MRINPAILYAAVETPFGLSALLSANVERLNQPGDDILEDGEVERQVSTTLAEDFGRVTISSLLERQERATERALDDAAEAA